MKKMLRFVGIAALAAVIGFGFASCEGPAGLTGTGSPGQSAPVPGVGLVVTVDGESAERIDNLNVFAFEIDLSDFADYAELMEAYWLMRVYNNSALFKYINVHPDPVTTLFVFDLYYEPAEDVIDGAIAPLFSFDEDHNLDAGDYFYVRISPAAGLFAYLQTNDYADAIVRLSLRYESGSPLLRFAVRITVDGDEDEIDPLTPQEQVDEAIDAIDEYGIDPIVVPWNEDYETTLDDAAERVRLAIVALIDNADLTVVVEWDTEPTLDDEGLVADDHDFDVLVFYTEDNDYYGETEITVNVTFLPAPLVQVAAAITAIEEYDFGITVPWNEDYETTLDDAVDLVRLAIIELIDNENLNVLVDWRDTPPSLTYFGLTADDYYFDVRVYYVDNDDIYDDTEIEVEVVFSPAV